MKKFALLFSLTLLVGCPGEGDRLPDTQIANVRFDGSTPCVTYTVEPGDRISYVQIGSYSDEQDSFQKILSEGPFIPNNKVCLPVFGYHFDSGKKYVVFYSVDNSNRERQRIIQVVFTSK